MDSTITAVTDDRIEKSELAFKSSLSRRLVHHIRNPLSAITTASSHLLDSPESQFADEDVSLLKAILVSADRLEETLRRFSGLVNDDDLEIEDLNLGDLCRVEVNHCLRFLPYDWDQDIVDYDFPDEPLMVEGDQQLIRNLLCNVIRNSFENFKPDCRLRIKGTRRRGRVFLEFIDTGPGIPADELAEVFKPFYSNHAGSAGLGLAICARAVERHRGFISIESKNQQGVTVKVSLPCKVNE